MQKKLKIIILVASLFIILSVIVFSISYLKSSLNNNLNTKTINQLPYQNNDVKLIDFKEGDLLTNKQIIKGDIKGFYFFEGTFPVIVEDLNGNVLGQSTTKITPNWQTENFISFETQEIEFNKKDNKEGYLVLKNDNPSGLPEYEKKIKIKVKF